VVSMIWYLMRRGGFKVVHSCLTKSFLKHLSASYDYKPMINHLSPHGQLVSLEGNFVPRKLNMQPCGTNSTWYMISTSGPIVL
jgi:hypothetical protein